MSPSPRRLFYWTPRGVSEEKFLGRRTPLYDLHVEQGARMVDFGGWDMPVNYGSQIEEHHAVRRDAGIFDVSHMCVIDARGPQVRDFFSRLLANDVAKLTTPGQGAVQLHAQRGRRRHRRPHRLLPDRELVPRRGQRRHSRQGPRLDAQTRAAVRRRADRARRSRDARGARTECARESGRAAAGRTSRRRAGARGVLRP